MTHVVVHSYSLSYNDNKVINNLSRGEGLLLSIIDIEGNVTNIKLDISTLPILLMTIDMEYSFKIEY